MTTHVAKHLYPDHSLESVSGLFRYLAVFLIVGLLSGVALLIVSRFVLIGLIIFMLLSR
jgi:hypothetical protein